MLRFFSNIRKALLAESRIRKYMLYAIGEIVLVVAGILIALQINNWNEDRKQARLGQDLLMELILEMQGDIGSFEWAIKGLHHSIARQEAALHTKDLRTLSIDSIYHLFPIANLDVETDQMTREKIKNAGITKLTTNDSLNDKLSVYLDQAALLTDRRTEWYWRRIKDCYDFLDYGQNEIDISRDKDFPAFDPVSEEAEKEAWIAFVNQPRTRNIIKESYTLSKNALRYYSIIRNHRVKFLREIHAEVSRHRDDVPALPEYTILEVPEKD